jgi:hypothetical protein
MNERTKRLTQDEVREEILQYGHVRTDAEMKLEKSKLELRRIGMLLHAHEDGKLLLSTLEDMFYDGALVQPGPPDPYTTYFKCGQREVVVFLHELRDQATKEK